MKNKEKKINIEFKETGITSNTFKKIPSQSLAGNRKGEKQKQDSHSPAVVSHSSKSTQQEPSLEYIRKLKGKYYPQFQCKDCINNPLQDTQADEPSIIIGGEALQENILRDNKSSLPSQKLIWTAEEIIDTFYLKHLPLDTLFYLKSEKDKEIEEIIDKVFYKMLLKIPEVEERQKGDEKKVEVIYDFRNELLKLLKG